MIVLTLARKPLIGSVASNVLKHGTGGLNIDGCRITTSPPDALAMERCNTPCSGRLHTSFPPIGTFITRNSSGKLDTTAGRWPANLILQHRPDCQHLGTTTISANWGQPMQRDTSDGGYHGNWPKDNCSVGYSDGHGHETVAAWNCSSNCPVKDLNDQSGVRVGCQPHLLKSNFKQNSIFGGVSDANRVFGYVDSPGQGAARYFKQVGGTKP